MGSWKTVVLLAVMLALAYVMYPRPREVSQEQGREEVTLWIPGSAALSLQTACEQFERVSKGKYKVVLGNATVRDATGDATRFLLGVAGGSPPDLIYYDRFAVVEAASRGAFAPLDEFIARDLDKPNGVRREDLFPPLWNESVYRGKQYGIATTADLRAMLVNDDLLERAGYVDGEGKVVPPKTWEDVCRKKVHAWGEATAETVSLGKDYELPGVGVMKRSEDGVVAGDVVVLIAGGDVFRARVGEVLADGSLKLACSGENGSSGDSVPVTMRGKVEVKVISKDSYTSRLTRFDERGRLNVIGFSPLFGNSWLYMFGWQNGAKFMSEDGETCLLDEPEVKGALQYVVDCYDAMGGYAGVKGFEGSMQKGALDPLLTGRVAMRIDGNWFLDTIATFRPDLRFTAVPAPLPAERLKAGMKPITWAGGWSYAIPATAKNKEGAWELLKFLVSPEGIRVQTEVNEGLARGRGKPFLPPLSPNIEMQRLARETYLANNPQITPRLLAAYDVYASMLPESRFRPVTPVGQKLWIEHADATQIAAGHKVNVHDALTAGTRQVQYALDRYLHPPKGTRVNWTYVFGVYGLVLAATAGVIAWSEVRRRRMKGGRRDWVAGYVCTAPWMIGFILLGAGPIVFSLVISFCKYDVLSPAEFIGFENYTQLLGFHTDGVTKELTANSQDFWIGLRNTGFMVLGVPLGIVVGMGIAMLLNADVKAMAFFRTVFYLPAIVPGVAAFLIWIWIFDQKRGALNTLLEWVGVWQGPAWLQSEDWAKPALLIMGLWGVGGGMLIWLAGLKSIPVHLYEAAKIDGCGPVRRFLHITLPMMSPYILFNTIMGLIGTFQIFEAAYVMTDGGPAKSTLFYAYGLFNEAFRYLNMGKASAMAWILFVIVLALTSLNLYFSKKWVHYD